MRQRYFLIFSVLIILGMLACEKGGNKAIDNPYDKVGNNNNNNGGKDSVIDPSSIAGLHKNLFKPTCANSGCHDGTFEPDFRTVQSSFNSLVNIKPIKNDTMGTFKARVVPGNDAGSILVYRMTVDLGGNSGIMPLVLDPGNDYESKKAGLLANLKKWINDGAKDMNGNPPPVVDFPPQILGVTGSVGSTPLSRGGKYEPMYPSAGSSVVLWFAFADDKTSQSALGNVKINWSTDPTSYVPSNAQSMSPGSKMLPGIDGTSTEHGWNYTFSTSGYKTGDVIWFRITCSDAGNTNYAIPNDNSMFFLKKYFAIKIL